MDPVDLIPAPTIAAISALLKPYLPNATPEAIVRAIHSDPYAPKLRTTSATDEYLDMRTAPRLCSLSRRTLDAAKARGELPFYKVGAKVLIARADLTAWMEARRVDVRDTESGSRYARKGKG